MYIAQSASLPKSNASKVTYWNTNKNLPYKLYLQGRFDNVFSEIK